MIATPHEHDSAALEMAHERCRELEGTIDRLQGVVARKTSEIEALARSQGSRREETLVKQLNEASDRVTTLQQSAAESKGQLQTAKERCRELEEAAHRLEGEKQQLQGAVEAHARDTTALAQLHSSERRAPTASPAERHHNPIWATPPLRQSEEPTPARMLDNLDALEQAHATLLHRHGDMCRQYHEVMPCTRHWARQG